MEVVHLHVGDCVTMRNFPVPHFQDVDWETYPAEMIIGTKNGKVRASRVNSGNGEAVRLPPCLPPDIAHADAHAAQQYLVKRRGLDYTAYGSVDMKAAKRQRLLGAAGGLTGLT